MTTNRAKRSRISSADDSEIARLKTWTRAVTKGEKDAACFMQLWSPRMREDPSSDPVPIMQLGYAMILDKPIVILAPLGTEIPENIRRVARAVEFFHPDDESSMRAATLRLLTAVGLTKDH